MNAPIYILATCRNPDLLPATLLVFRTLRTGFPHAPVKVFGNGLSPEHSALVQQAAAEANADYVWVRKTAHDVWLEHLVQDQAGPFWICDTDMVFFQPVPAPPPGAWLSGRFEPGFAEEWTQSWHAERLHTCLLYLDPQQLRAKMRAWMTEHVPAIFGHAETHFIRQHFVPLVGLPRCGDRTSQRDVPTTGNTQDRTSQRDVPTNGNEAERTSQRDVPTTLFMDTAAGLYHAFGGTPFDTATDECFEHLHCGTYSDLVAGCASLKDLPAVHAAIIKDGNAARELLVAQQRYYASRSI
jgi:hypothetical protein